MKTQATVWRIGLVLAVAALLMSGAAYGGKILMPIFGGTGTSTRFTLGSIPFSGSTATGVYHQDNTNLSFNPTTHVLTATGGLTSTGPVSGTTGTFTGAVSGTTGTFTGAVSGTTGTFTGTVGKAGANGQVVGIKQLTELTTIAAAATTDTAIQIPAGAIVLGVSVRVTTVIPTAATFTVIGASSSTAFQTGASVSTAATTTDAGTKSCPYLNATAQAIRFTPNAQPADNTGRVRVTIHYIEVTPATS